MGLCVGVGVRWALRQYRFNTDFAMPDVYQCDNRLNCKPGAPRKLRLGAAFMHTIETLSIFVWSILRRAH